jgi:ketosteroid isomerase-like protein
VRTTLIPFPESATSGQRDTDLTQAITDAMTSADIESIINLFAPDCEWVIMATGERFRGQDKIRQLAKRSLGARNQPGGLGIKLTNTFTNPEKTKLCWEFVHTAVITDTSPTRRLAAGTKFELPIILMCDIHQDKLVKVREYFDILSAVEPGTPHRLYS